MIPVRQPSFSINAVLSRLVGFERSCSVEQIERIYAEHFSVNEAVLLPSCRSGMSWILRLIGEDYRRVVCPAFTCDVVWESIRRAHKEPVIVDIEQDKFLMDTNLLGRELYGDYALILCEIYGYTYDLKEIEVISASKPLIRIIDMAMTVPGITHFDRLADNDVAFLSFGSGKCLFAGSGGMALSHNTELMKKMRSYRDINVVGSDPLFTLRQNIKTSLFTFIHEPLLYSKPAKKIIGWKRSKGGKNVHGNSSLNVVEDNYSLSKEWYAMPTGMSRSLMDYNLRHMRDYSQKRKILADCYHKNLESVEEIRVPEESGNTLSHFTILVEKSVRPGLIKQLYAKGIETNKLFFLPNSFSSEKLPNTWNISREIINLPINVRLQLNEVKRICDVIKEALVSLRKQRVFTADKP